MKELGAHVKKLDTTEGPGEHIDVPYVMKVAYSMMELLKDFLRQDYCPRVSLLLYHVRYLCVLYKN